MRVFVLDDMDERHAYFSRKYGDTSRAWTAAQAVEVLSHGGPFDLAYLDHDLGDNPDVPSNGTGLDVAHWLAHNTRFLPRRVVIHSWNPDGARAMVLTLLAAGASVEARPFRGGPR